MPTTVATGMRRPRRQGAPPIWAGFTVILVSFIIFFPPLQLRFLNWKPFYLTQPQPGCSALLPEAKNPFGDGQHFLRRLRFSPFSRLLTSLWSKSLHGPGAPRTFPRRGQFSIVPKPCPIR